MKLITSVLTDRFVQYEVGVKHAQGLKWGVVYGGCGKAKQRDMLGQGVSGSDLVVW